MVQTDHDSWLLLIDGVDEQKHSTGLA